MPWVTGLSSASTGVVAGLAGTTAMTAFQRIVEMPLTRRAESDAPLQLLEKLLPLPRARGGARRPAVYAAHFTVGAGWGLAHAKIQRVSGTRGLQGGGIAFAALYSGDVLINTALGLYEPAEWSQQDWLVDVGNKVVLAIATSLFFDRLTDA